MASLGKCRRIHGALLFLCVAVAAVSGCSWPPQIGVVEGEGFLKKVPAFAELGDLPGGLRLLPARSEEGLVLASFGTSEVLFLDSTTGATKERIRFEKPWPGRPWHVFPNWEGPGYRYVLREPLRLVDNSRGVLWSYPANLSIEIPMILAGDLDANGRPEFYVQRFDALVQLDEHGKESWRVPRQYGVYRSAAICQRGPGGVPCIVSLLDPCNGYSSALEFRDGTGALLMQTILPTYVSLPWAFAVVRWPTEECILTAYGREYSAWTLKGALVFSESLPPLRRLNIVDLEAAVVRHDSTGQPLLAIMLGFPFSSRCSMLLVHDPTGRVIYEEVVPRDSGLLKLPSGETPSLITWEPSRQHKQGGSFWRYVPVARP